MGCVTSRGWKGLRVCIWQSQRCMRHWCDASTVQPSITALGACHAPITSICCDWADKHVLHLPGDAVIPGPWGPCSLTALSRPAASCFCRVTSTFSAAYSFSI
jgi:hypothetical protein